MAPGARGTSRALLKKLGGGRSGETVDGGTGSTSGCVKEGLARDTGEPWVPPARSYDWGTIVPHRGDR